MQVRDAGRASSFYQTGEETESQESCLTCLRLRKFMVVLRQSSLVSTPCSEAIQNITAINLDKEKNSPWHPPAGLVYEPGLEVARSWPDTRAGLCSSPGEYGQFHKTATPEKATSWVEWIKTKHHHFITMSEHQQIMNIIQATKKWWSCSSPLWSISNYCLFSKDRDITYPAHR